MRAAGLAAAVVLRRFGAGDRCVAAFASAASEVDDGLGLPQQEVHALEQRREETDHDEQHGADERDNDAGDEERSERLPPRVRPRRLGDAAALLRRHFARVGGETRTTTSSDV